MKKAKISELKNLGKAQLEERLAEVKKELLKVNAKIATKVVPDNPGSIKQLKKAIAKILTVKNQKSTKVDGKTKTEEKDKTK